MTLDIPNLNIESEENDLVSACHKLIEQQGDNSEGRNFQIDYILGILNLKRQKELLSEQNVFNKKLLGDNYELIKQNRSLAKATWVLAIFTIILAIAAITSIIITIKCK